MSDEQTNEPRDQMSEGLPPGGPPAVPSDASYVPEAPPVAGRRRPLAYVAITIGLLAMIGGAIFFARSIGTAEGAKTPEAAVQRMFDALSNEDFLGVIEALQPAERTLLSGRIQSIAQELGRLKILRSDVDLGDVRGIELSFSGLKYKTEQLSAGFSAVTITAGRVDYRVDPTQSPLGDFVRGLLPPSAAQVISGSDTVTDNENVFVAVEEDGSWYVSLGYTIAEGARRGAGAPAPSFGGGVPARGATSPEAAVDQFLRAAAGLDVRRLIELVPRGEAGALHDYAPLFLADAERGAKEARTQFDLAIRTLDLSTKASGDEAVVKIDKIAFRLSVPAIELSLDYDGRCATIQGAENFLPPGTPGRLCGEQLTGSAGLPRIGGTPDTGIVAVREGGSWYVSPTGTVLEGLIGVLKAFKASDLDMLKQLFSSFAGVTPPTSIPIPIPSG